MPDYPSVDFAHIAAHGGAQTAAFEEFCAQLARHVDKPEGSVFQRNGRGADLGVECIWRLPDGTKWGWQAKFVFEIDALKAQVDKSFSSALKGHPTLAHYYVCFPFQPSAAPGKGKSQQEKLKEYKAEWESMAAAQGRMVTVEFWPASELMDRLLDIDEHGGRRLFWFGEPVLTPTWFQQHISTALKLAEPRYTPKLTVKHALSSVLDALGSTQGWELQFYEWRTTLDKCREDWKRSLAEAEAKEVPEFPKALIPEGKALLDKIKQLVAAYPTESRDVQWDELRRLAFEARVAQEPLQDSLRSSLDATHGDGASQSKRFREYQAEYQAAFPAQHYDSAQELGETLGGFVEWLETIDVRSNIAGFLLITGAAGIGKTHSVCDVAAAREDAKLFSILLFGVRFRAGVIWDQIRLQLGLGGGWTENALFDALDAAAETTGRPLILFIDALNESQPRTLWRAELGALLQALRKRSHLRLCVTCRTDYASAVIEQSLDIPRFEHPGFAGYEFDACQSFFAHYELEPPIGPLFDPEFSNPLFLKLTCEALRGGNLKRLPAGWSGFRAIFRALLEQQDREWQAGTGSVVRNAITRALESLAAELARRSRRSIPLEEASALISKLGVDGESVLRQLLEHDLVMRVPVLAGSDAGLLIDLHEEVAFAYERLGDHLQVQAALRSAASGPLQPEVVQLALTEPGYCEALSIQLPELRAQELLDVIPEDTHSVVVASWLRGLEWRDLRAITERTEHWLRVLLDRSKKAWFQTFDALLVLAVRPGHHLDKFFSKQLSALSQAERDSFWCTYLHYNWEEQNSLHPVRRLVNSVWNLGGATIDVEFGISWLRVLCWFFAAADRRVRDHASRAAVRLAEKQPIIWVRISEEMLRLDDDYVVERILACAYGTHLRVRDDKALRELANVVAPILAEDTRANALIRDHARCICELALQRKLKLGFTPESVRPPFKSEWPLKIPTVEDLSRFDDADTRERYPNLYESTIDDFRGDFAIYTVPHAIDPYSEAIESAEACRWIFQHVLDLGYTPERFMAYDAHMISKFGGGRSRPKWAERIGKKYQWIALARLLGRLADHVSAEQEDWEDAILTPLAAQTLRDIDVSIDGIPVTDEEQYKRDNGDLMSGNPESDEEWVADASEVLRIEESLWAFRRDQNEEWYPLEAHVSVVDKNERPKDRGFRRQIWVQVRSYLVPRGDFQRLWNWLSSKRFMNERMPEGLTIGDNVFVGEYPQGLSLGLDGLADVEPVELDEVKCSVIPTTHDVHPEFAEDSSSAKKLTTTVPIPQLLGDRRWNGRGGYVDHTKRLVFVDPFAESGGISGCFIRKEDLHSYLENTGMSLVWTVLSEKLPGDYRAIRRLEYSHIRGLHEGSIRVARDPVLART